MAVEKSVVDQQLAALGKYSTFFTKKEIKCLPEILIQGETIKAVTSGFMDSHTWLFVVTDQRIIMLDKGMFFGVKQLVLPLGKIKSVSYKTGLFWAQSSLTRVEKQKYLIMWTNALCLAWLT